MPYYTKSGDLGRTCILGSGRVQKDDLRIEALGDFDELSCALGVAAAFSDDKATKKTLENIQNDLHTVCAEISGCNSPEYPLIKRRHVAELEEAIAKIERAVGEQRTFILPGGSRQAAFIHMGRAVARRAERRLVRLAKKQEIRNELLTYANRLSTLLHVLARLQNRIRSLHEYRPVYRHQD